MAELTSFNPLKVLLWRDQLEAITKGEFLPPVAVHIDITQDCNFNCPHCNVKDLRAKRYMPKEHLMKLADFITDWGVKATYVAVTGESMLHPDWVPFIYRLKGNGIEIGVVTNGSLMDEERRQALVECSWVGVSVDAHNRETYAKVHGVNEETFNTVVNNIEKLAGMKSALDITLKYLILPSNWQGIYSATLLARSIGANAIHIRPAILANNYPGEPIKIKAMVEKAKELDTETFRVHATKLDILSHGKRNMSFQKCRAATLGAIFATDGLVYLCCGLVGERRATIGSHYPDPHQVLGFWGGEGHKVALDAIDPRECPRCNLTAYQEVVEQVIIRDGMFKKFV